MLLREFGNFRGQSHFIRAVIFEPIGIYRNTDFLGTCTAIRFPLKFGLLSHDHDASICSSAAVRLHARSKVELPASDGKVYNAFHYEKDGDGGLALDIDSETTQFDKVCRMENKAGTELQKIELAIDKELVFAGIYSLPTFMIPELAGVPDRLTAPKLLYITQGRTSLA